MIRNQMSMPPTGVRSPRMETLRPAHGLPASSRLRVGLVLAAALQVFVQTAQVARAADEYPLRPITLVNASTPGAGGDLTSRVIGAALTRELGQPIIVINRAGAAGNLAMESVARAAPDGYTLLVGFTGHVINPGLFKKLPFDPVADFTPISFLAANMNLLVVRNDLPARSVKELISMARSSPGKLTIGSYAGTSQHLAGALFNTMAGIDVLNVPYKNSTDPWNDLLAGRIDYVFATYNLAKPAVDAGKLRVLGIADTQRSILMPDIPPISDTVPGYSARGWYGLFGPAGMPRAVTLKLHATLARALKTNDVKDKLVGMGSEPLASGSPEQFAEFIKTEIPRWSKVIREAGIEPQ